MKNVQHWKRIQRTHRVVKKEGKVERIIERGGSEIEKARRQYTPREK